MTGPTTRRAAVRILQGGAATMLAVLLATAPVAGQEGASALTVSTADGSERTVQTEWHRGHAALPAAFFRELGWAVGQAETAVALSGPHGVVLTLRIGSPFFFWDDEVLQLADAPYREGSEVYLPVQLVADFIPRRMPELYAFESDAFTLRAADPADWGGTVIETVPFEAAPPEEHAAEEERPREPAARPAEEEAPPVTAEPYDGERVVVIDAGHGGGDPGALGNGVREKEVALGIAREMANLLGREPGIRVYMTRDNDTFVPIWDRGDQATEWKGERPGIFVSLHANALNNRSVRGFETYFLSEARTEHERRVAAIENAPLQVRGQNIDPSEEPDLGFILRELRTLDHQHWSALLAEFVQEEIAKFHPGPNRGVKQGILAVLTNAIMPSVLVEIGFLSNEDEGPLLGQRRFQEESARSIARAIVRFFERYPPGSGTGGSGAGL